MSGNSSIYNNWCFVITAMVMWCTFFSNFKMFSCRKVWSVWSLNSHLHRYFLHYYTIQFCAEAVYVLLCVKQVSASLKDISKEATQHKTAASLLFFRVITLWDTLWTKQSLKWILTKWQMLIQTDRINCLYNINCYFTHSGGNFTHFYTSI